MPYLTFYSLETTFPDGVEPLDQRDWNKYIAHEEVGITYLFEMMRKWKEHESDMRRISAKYVDHLFTLKGEGEDSGDLWVKYFKNGKMYAPKTIIRFRPFNESLLK